MDTIWIQMELPSDRFSKSVYKFYYVRLKSGRYPPGMFQNLEKDADILISTA